MSLPSPCPDDIPASLWQAYADTLFVFRDGQQLGVLRVGEPPDAVTAAVLQREGVTSGVFITAYWTQEGDFEEIHRDNQVLLDTLRKRGLKCFPGAGIGTDVRHDPEASLFVPGVDEDEAVDLGRRFGQNAVVWVENGAPARLLASV